MRKSKFIIALSLSSLILSGYLSASAIGDDAGTSATSSSSSHLVSGEKRLDLLCQLIAENPDFNNYTPHRTIKELFDKDWEFLSSLPDDYRDNWKEIFPILRTAVKNFIDRSKAEMSLAEYYVVNFAWVKILATTSGSDARKAFFKFFDQHDSIKVNKKKPDDSYSQLDYVVRLLYCEKGLCQSSTLVMPVLSKTSFISADSLIDNIGMVVGDRAFTVAMLGVGTDEKQNFDQYRNDTAEGSHNHDCGHAERNCQLEYPGRDRSDEHRAYDKYKKEVLRNPDELELAKSKLATLMLFRESLLSITQLKAPGFLFATIRKYKQVDFMRNVRGNVSIDGPESIEMFESHIELAESLGIKIEMSSLESIASTEDRRPTKLIEEYDIIRKYITFRRIMLEGLCLIAPAFDEHILNYHGPESLTNLLTEFIVKN